MSPCLLRLILLPLYIILRIVAQTPSAAAACEHDEHIIILRHHHHLIIIIIIGCDDEYVRVLVRYLWLFRACKDTAVPCHINNTSTDVRCPFGITALSSSPPRPLNKCLTTITVDQSRDTSHIPIFRFVRASHTVLYRTYLLDEHHS